MVYSLYDCIYENSYGKFSNTLFGFNYRHGDVLLRIMYDKYIRPELYKRIDSLSPADVIKLRDEIKSEMNSNLKTIPRDKLKDMKVDENIPDTDILHFENKSIEFLRINTNAINMQITSTALSSIMLLSIICLYPVRRVRNHKYSRLLAMCASFNLMLFNTYLIVSNNGYNKINRGFLQEKYKRQVEKYNLVYDK